MIKIKKIRKDYGGFPIRWIAETEDGELITIRERGCQCVVYKGDKSIFSVEEEDVIVNFETKESCDDGTLVLALEKMNAILLPSVLEDIVLDYGEDVEYG